MIKNKNIIVEGWRNVSHSYALVNQFQILHWRKNCNANINAKDAPFIMNHWYNGGISPGFSHQDNNIINEPGLDANPNGIYKIFAPLELKCDPKLPTLTFAVTELGLDDTLLNKDFIKSYSQDGGKIHTPSNWSKDRLINSGIPSEIIKVIPHGVDENYFHKISNDFIEQLRTNLKYTPDDVIFGNIGSYHWNKGLDILIKAFAIAHKKNRNIKLLLKDQRMIYSMNSEDYVRRILMDIGINDREVINSINFYTNHLSFSDINQFYNIIDSYITPYRAEGFNLPALEAQFCGTPVIATLGGATDDFLSDQFSNKFLSGEIIQGATLSENLKNASYIEPNIEELIYYMINSQRKSCNKDTPLSLNNWSKICDDLLFFCNLN
jgi:glycosyltransferase involved in cell wall biosynthesis